MTMTFCVHLQRRAITTFGTKHEKIAPQQKLEVPEAPLHLRVFNTLEYNHATSAGTAQCKHLSAEFEERRLEINISIYDEHNTLF